MSQANIPARRDDPGGKTRFTNLRTGTNFCATSLRATVDAIENSDSPHIGKSSIAPAAEGQDGDLTAESCRTGSLVRGSWAGLHTAVRTAAQRDRGQSPYRCEIAVQGRGGDQTTVTLRFV